MGKVDECWEWAGARTGGGYGSFIFQGICYSVHREMYKFFKHLQIPEGYYICHHCDNPACCNPKHLYAGTPKDNARDRVERGRQVQGETHPAAKLTNAEVGAIRKVDLGKTSIAQLAEDYGVAYSVIWRVVRNLSYKGA